MFKKGIGGICGCALARACFVSYTYIQQKNDKKPVRYGGVYLGTKNVYLQTFDDLICDACKKIDKKIST